MDAREVERLLRKVRAGGVSVETALARLRTLPFENLGFARIDHHRRLRQGMPEVVYCEGKTEAQAQAIIRRMVRTGYPVLATRAAPGLYRKVKRIAREAVYHPLSRCLVVDRRKRAVLKGMVAVITAGTSDIPAAEEAAVTARLLGSRVEMLCDVGVAGIHRLVEARELLEQARVLIVAAGMDGALASVVGGLAACPVIALPTSVGYGASFRGLAALLAMLSSCAPGVAVVNIDNGYGAGVLAHKINVRSQKSGVRSQE